MNKLKKVNEPIPYSNMNLGNMCLGITHEIPFEKGEDIDRRRRIISSTVTRYKNRLKASGFDFDYKVWKNGNKIFIKRIK